MSTSVRDRSIVEALNGLIAQVGGDPADITGTSALVRDIMQTTLSLLRDQADPGEAKLIARSLRELRYALKIFRPYRDTRKVSIFGSARTPVDHSDYRCAARFAQAIAASGWMVITGAGDGIMRAGHEGAGPDASFGVSIRLPFETNANDIIKDSPRLVTFRYFFTRKLMFVWQAHALVLLPGGFGTLDECFEVLTLIQTGKAPMIPVVMLAPRDNDYWHHFDHYARSHLLAKGMISPEDLNLYHIFDDPDAAAHHVLNFYRNYHSERMVGDRFVIRMLHALTDAQLQAINAEFSDLVADGRIEQSGPLEGETVHLELPRLHYTSTRRSFARHRALIDRINQFAA
jgi:uncharacterized protein (TIGR00730 family)